MAACLIIALVPTERVAAAGPDGDLKAGEEAREFDIAAAPLADALDVYNRLTGASSLIDQAIVAGRRSSAVKGMLTDDQALRFLLSGTGLSIRYVGKASYTLVPAEDRGENEPRSRDGTAGVNFGSYFADLQKSLEQVLCRRPGGELGRARIGMQIWLDGNGRVLASHLLESGAGGGSRDVLVDMLRDSALAPPPAGLPMPVTIVLQPRQGAAALDCGGGGDRQ